MQTRADIFQKSRKTVSGKCMGKILTIPNILSFVRLAMIPMIIWLYAEKNEPVWAAVLLVASGVTDTIDGYIARRFDQVSSFGKVIDPIADKLTQLLVLICIAQTSPKIWIPVILLIVKEGSAIICGLLVMKKKGQINSSVWHGKVTTVLLYGLMLIHTLWAGIPEWLSNTLICICVAMMLVSCVLYLVRNIRILKGETVEETNGKGN